MDHKVFVASRSFSSNMELRDILEQKFSNVSYNEAGRVLTEDELSNALVNVTHLIVAMENVGDSLLQKCETLKVVSKYGVGLDNIDFNALEKRGIFFGWTGGVNRQSVAELALSSMISLLHLVPQIQTEVRGGIWRQTAGNQLYGKKVGIIGCGYVGKRLIELLEPFDCEILAHDIKIDFDFLSKHNYKYVDLNLLLQASDVITLHLPLTKDTYHFLGKEEINLMKKGTYLLNYARGGLIDEESLLVALNTGKIRGAALDVLEDEPVINHELLRHQNLIITSHIGGSAKEAILAMGKAAINGLINPRPISFYCC